MLKVSIYCVDDSIQDWRENDGFWLKLQKLQNQGYNGKKLINILISDDWAAPPKFVCIEGTLSNGSKIDTTISYSD